MTLRITTTSEPGRTIVKIDGRLGKEDWEDVAGVLRTLAGPTALDLSELVSIDRAATELLQEVIATGVELRAASPYVELLLRTRPGRHC